MNLDQEYSDTMLSPQQTESVCGYTTGQHSWYECWLFGIIVDDTVGQLGGYWQPDGRIANGYYFPSEEDIEIEITCFSPPVQDAAYDARPI